MKNSYSFTRLLIVIICVFAFSAKGQNPINQKLFGQNAWFINNNGTSPAGDLTGLYPYMDSSGVTYVRIGGIDANFKPLYTWTPGLFTVNAAQVSKLTELIDSLRKYGMEPIITVGYDPVCSSSVLSGISRTNAAKIAGNVVDVINNTLYPTNRIKTWIIANEPDLRDTCNAPLYGGFDYKVDAMGHADSIAIYIREFATAMKDKDSSIRIVGPELSSFGTDVNYSVNKITNKLASTAALNGILGTITSTGQGNGKFFIDHLTVHKYPIINSRQQCIDNPTDTVSGFKGILEANNPSGFRKGLVKMITSNTTRTPSNLKLGLTEYNIDNASADNESTNLPGVIKGYDYRSFLGGQWLAQMLSVGMSNPWVENMNLWSVQENGISGDGCQTGWGYISNCGSGNRLRSQYHHFSLVANYFHGKYYAGQSNKPNVKTFSSVETGAGFYIMVLNMDTVDYVYDISFNGNTTASYPLHLTYNVSSEEPLVTNTSSAVDTIEKKSTILILFDCNGVKLWKKVYSEQDNLNDVEPHLKQIGNNDVDPQIAACGMPGIGGNISSSVTYSNTTVYINSNITLVGAGTKLTFDNAIVIMAPNVKIKSNPNTSIEIKNNTKMFGCNGQKWEGIEMNGNYLAGQKLHISNSYIFNAKHPVVTDKISDLKIIGNVFANGETAVDLRRGEAFEITGNIIAGYKTGIKTSKTKGGFVSGIKENKFIEIITDVHFDNDLHNALEITCNEFRYKDRSIRSVNTDLKVQGTATLSAGNNFISDAAGTPVNYIDHTGTATQYYFGPAEANKFVYPNVMNIPKIQAVSDKVCLQQMSAPCGALIGIEENNKPNAGFSIYPNPSTGAFTINFSNLPTGNWVINVTDVLGRMISTKKVDSNSESTTLQINAKGLYFVSLQSGGNRITQKVIVE